MKILIISYFFPPLNNIGSIRVGKVAKYFHQFGHDIRVITIKHMSEDLSAPIEIPNEYCIQSEIIKFEQTINRNEYDRLSYTGKLIVRVKKAIIHKKPSFLLPDSSWPWYSEGVDKADKILESWKPDLIYSSALPISSHFIARRISKKYSTPWVAEYRDLWSGGHGARVSAFSSFFLKRIEKWLLKQAIGLITVSQPLAAYLRFLHKKNVSVIYNGFEVNPNVSNINDKVKTKDTRLSIVYTGSIYEGRDPEILFDALNRLGHLKEKVQVKFYTSKNNKLIQRINEYNVGKCVKVMNYVPYSESLKIQAEADILLYLSYSSVTHKGRGILSGKVFEYLGAARPILSVGADSKHLLIDQGLMIHFNDAEKLAKKLVYWVGKKDKSGTINVTTDLNKREEYSRLNQTKRAETFIKSLLVGR